MWTLSLICLLAAAAQAHSGYARQTAGVSGVGSAAGAGAGAGFGNFGTAGYGSGFPYAQPPFPFFAPVPPAAPFIDPQEYNKILTQYFDALQKNYAALYQQQLAQQQAIFNAIKQQTVAAGAGAGAGVGAGGGYAPGFGTAGSTASIGGGQIHQTTFVSPENPASPNVDTRFDATPAQGGNPGFYGVSTSSFSQSSDVNGMKTNRRGSVTTVNDNGKVTTYESHV